MLYSICGTDSPAHWVFRNIDFAGELPELLQYRHMRIYSGTERIVLYEEIEFTQVRRLQKAGCICSGGGNYDVAGSLRQDR